MKTPTDGPNGRRILVFTRIVLARGVAQGHVGYDNHPTEFVVGMRRIIG